MNPVTHKTDLDLVKSALDGTPEASEELIQRLGCIPIILNRKNRKLPFPFNKDELLDLAQDVFARVWAKLGTFAGEGCLEAWIYRFCHNVMMNAQQSRWRGNRHREAAQEVETEERETDSISFDERIALFEALSTLDPDEAEVIELKHFEGLSFSGIAERIQISSNSAKTRYYRGLKRLENKLGPIFREGPK